jgi:hypothetical protein
MNKISPIKIGATGSNLRTIRDPDMSVSAIVTALESVKAARAEPGMSSLRRVILDAICKAHPDEVRLPEIQLRAGVSAAVVREHVKALRWKGLVMFGSLRPSPSALQDFTSTVFTSTAFTGASLLPPGDAGASLNDTADAPALLPPSASLTRAEGGLTGAAPAAPVLCQAAQKPQEFGAKSVNDVIKQRGSALKTADQFAEYLSEGWTVTEASRALGLSADYGRAMLCRLRRKLGAQAV